MRDHVQNATAPSVYTFSANDLRVVLINDEPWFVATDVCSALGMGNPSMAVAGLDEDEVTLSTIEGSHRSTNLINESGLYSLIFKSRKPEAKKFKRWVTHEVLPAIRKTGGYGYPVEQPVDRITYQQRERLAAAVRSVTYGFSGQSAAYAVNERVRRHFGVKRIEDLTVIQAQDAILLVEHLRPLTQRWIRAMRAAEKDFLRQVLRDESGPMLSAPTLVCLDIDSAGLVTPLRHEALLKLQKANRGMHDMLALFQSEEE